MLSLQPSDPLPGLRVRTHADWGAVQQAMQAGASLSPNHASCESRSRNPIVRRARQLRAMREMT